MTPDTAPTNGTPSILGPDGRPLRHGGDAPGGNPLFALPHPYTFASIFNLASKVYSWRWDEAYRHNSWNAIAMRRDPNLMGMLQERLLPTAQMPWHLESENKLDLSQKKVAESLTRIINATPYLQRFLRTALNAVWYGRYGVQKLYGPKVIDGQKRTVILDHRPVNGDKIQFRYRTAGDGPEIVDGAPAILVHATASTDLPDADFVLTDRGRALLLQRPYWRDRFLIHKFNPDDADYFEGEMAGQVHGVGLRSLIYWMNWLKLEIQSWLMDFSERIGLGWTVFYYEMGNKASHDAAIASAKEYGRNTVIVVPRSTAAQGVGAGVERIEAGTAGSTLILELQKYFDDKIERLVIGQTASSRSETSGLGTHDTDLQADTKYRIIKGDCLDLQQTLTTDLVDPLQRFNHPEADFPLYWIFDVDRPDPEKKMAAVQAFVQLGGEVDEDEVRSIAGLSKPLEGAPTLGGQQQMGMGPDGQPLPGAEPDAASKPGQGPLGNGKPPLPGGPKPPGGGKPSAATPPAPGKQRFHRETPPLDRKRRSGRPQRYAGEPGPQHAPAGGVTLGGYFYAGGEFIPGEALERATPEERAALGAPEGQSGRHQEKLAAYQETYKDWEERGAKRERAREVLEKAMSANPSDNPAPESSQAREAAWVKADEEFSLGPTMETHVGDMAAALSAVRAYAGLWKPDLDAQDRLLQEAGASAKELAGYRKARDRAEGKVAKRLDGYTAAAERVAAAGKTLTELQATEPTEPEYPEEPDEPDYPDEPELDTDAWPDEPAEPAEPAPDADAGTWDEYHQEHADWAKETDGLQAEFDRAHEAWEAETERLQEEFDRVHGQWDDAVEKADADHEKAGAKWEKAVAKAEERLGKERDRFKDIGDELADAISEMDTDTADAAQDVTDGINERLDDEESDDEEPEEPEDDEEEESPTLFRRRGRPRRYDGVFDWVESQHPRDETGQFTEGSGAAAAGSAVSATTPPKPVPRTGKKPAASKGVMAEARRQGTGKEATIVLADGTPAPAHIKPGMVPPQWTDVKISLDPNAEVLVQARDKAGRPKTVYADTFHMRNAALKFARIREGLQKRKEIFHENQTNRRDPALREEADCVWLMQIQATRPGSETDTKAKVKAFGATTLLGRHIVLDEYGGVRLRFVGKEGVKHDHHVRDPQLAEMLLERKRAAGDDGALFQTSYARVTSYAKTLDAGRFTPKDFRTVVATNLAVREIGRAAAPTTVKEYKARVKEVATRVSRILGNRPAQALESYIDPTVFSSWRAALKGKL